MSRIRSFVQAMKAEWARLGHDSALAYGHREVVRTKDLDMVTLGNGRIVFHAGSYPSGSAGELSATVIDDGHDSGFNVATHWNVFTVHCHGFDASYPDENADGAQEAHDDAVWTLMEQFVGAFVRIASIQKVFYRISEPEWVRDPMERRFGEKLMFQVAVSFGVRQAPEYPKQHPTPQPTAIVETPAGDVEVIGENA